MFTAELMSLLYFNYQERKRRLQEKADVTEETPLVAQQPAQTSQPYLLVAIPAFCDLAGVLWLLFVYADAHNNTTHIQARQ